MAGASGDDAFTREILDLVGCLYDAAADSRNWPGFLARLCRFFDAPMGQFSYIDSGTREISFNVLHNVDPALLGKYAEISAAGGDPRATSMATHQDQARHCRDVCSEGELHASRIYTEVLKPCGIEYSLMAKATVSAGRLGLIGAMRGPHQVPFDRGDADTMALLLPHMRRALGLHAQFTVLEWQRDSAFAVLDGMEPALAILQRDGTVLFRNRAMRDLAGDGSITVTNGRISCATVSAQSFILSAVERCCRGMGGLSAEATVIPIPREAGCDLAVRVSAVQGQTGLAVLFATDPGAAFVLSRQVLTQLYGLTPSEADISSMLAEGRTPEEVSLILGISMNTVKTHLKRSYGKVGVTRQADLVRLLLTGPARARDGHG